jgi:hypothetical protein
VATRYPRRVSSGTSFSIRVVFPLSDFPTIEIIGINLGLLGMLKYWNTGRLILLKKLNPIFHHSILPLFQFPIVLSFLLKDFCPAIEL